MFQKIGNMLCDLLEDANSEALRHLERIQIRLDWTDGSLQWNSEATSCDLSLGVSSLFTCVPDLYLSAKAFAGRWEWSVAWFMWAAAQHVCELSVWTAGPLMRKHLVFLPAKGMDFQSWRWRSSYGIRFNYWFALVQRHLPEQVQRFL